MPAGQRAARNAGDAPAAQDGRDAEDCPQGAAYTLDLHIYASPLASLA